MTGVSPLGGRTMTGLVRKALAVAAGLTVVASVAMASVPDPRNSSVETPMVGGSSGNLLAGIGGAGYEVTVRDINNTPLANQTVVLDFSAAPSAGPGAPRIKLYTVQNAVVAGTTVNCAARTLSKLTNVSGQAIFGPRYGGFVNTADVVVSAQAVTLANVPARSTDIDGVGAT